MSRSAMAILVMVLVVLLSGCTQAQQKPSETSSSGYGAAIQAILESRAAADMTLEQLESCFLDSAECNNTAEVVPTARTAPIDVDGVDLKMNAGGSAFPTYEDGELDNCNEYAAAPVAVPPVESRYSKAEWQGWHNMHKEIVETWHNKINMVFYGDSLTIKWNEYPTAFWCDSFTSGDSCTAEVRSIFEKNFGWPFNAVPLGIAGDTSLHLLHRLQDGEFGDMEPEMVVLLIGTNDLTTYWDWFDVVAEDDPDVFEEMAESVFRSVQNVVVQIKQKSCDTFVLIQGILPRGNMKGECEECYEDFKPVIESINAKLEQFAEEADGLGYVYCGHIFLEKEGDKVDTFLLPDLVHPETEGYELWAECLREEMDKLPYLSGIEEKHSYNFYFDQPIDIDKLITLENVKITDLFTAEELAMDCDANSAGNCYNTLEIWPLEDKMKDCDDWEDLKVPEGQFDGRDDVDSWEDAHKDLKKLLDEYGDQNVHVVIYGDTVVEDLGDQYTDILQEEMSSKFNTLTMGIAGDTALNLLKRIEDGEADDLEAKVAVILSGSYDLTKYYPDGIIMGDSLEAFQDYAALRIAYTIEAIAARIKQENCDTHVVVLGTLPRGNTRGGCELCTDNFEEAVATINYELEEFADRSAGVDYVDCRSELMDGNDLDSSYVEEDGVSLTSKGTARVLACLAEALAAMDALEDIPYHDVWANRVTFADLFTEDQLDSSCSASDSGTCYTDEVVPGYGGQELTSCSVKKGLDIPDGDDDGREDVSAWEDLHNAHKSIGEKYEVMVDLLFIGDGLVAQWNEGAEHQGIFQDYLAHDLNAVAFGIEGDTAMNVLWRLQHGEADDLEPKVAVVYAGINDITKYIPKEVLQGNPDEAGQMQQDKLSLAADRAANATQAVALELLKSDCIIRVVVLGLLPRGDEPYFAPIISLINERLEAFGKSDDITQLDYLDCTASVTDSSGDLDGSMYLSDKATLDKDGLQQISKCIRQHLDGVEELEAVSGLGRNFYVEALQGTIFNEVDTRIGGIDAVGAMSSCSAWQSPAVSEGYTDFKDQQGQWLSDHGKYVALVDTLWDKAGLVFYGEENTLRWNSEGRAVFEQYFAIPFNAIAMGLEGDTTMNIQWRLSKGEMSPASGPGVAVVMPGSHDFVQYVQKDVVLGKEGSEALQEAAEAVGHSIQHIVARIKQLSCDTTVIVVGALPRGGFTTGASWDDFEDITRATNAYMKGWVGAASGVEFVDCTDQLLDSSGQLDGSLYEGDYLRLSQEGFEALAKCTHSAVAGAMPPTASLNTNLIFSDGSDVNFLDASVASLFSPEDLLTECSPQSAGTCYKATTFPAPPQAFDSPTCPAWGSLEVLPGTSDGRESISAWAAEHAKLRGVLTESEGSSASVVFVGDDNVRRFNDDDGRGIFENYFARPLGAVAAGIAGDTSLNVLWRIQDGELGSAKPAVMVFHAGTNDLTRYFPPQAVGSDSVAQVNTITSRIVNGTAASVAELKKHHCDARVVVLGLLPRTSSPGCPSCGWDHFRPAVESINRALAEAWEFSPDVSFVDCSLPLLGSPSQVLSGALSSDGVSLAPGGLAAVSECVYQHIRLMGPLAMLSAPPGGFANAYFGGLLPEAQLAALPSPDNSLLFPLFDDDQLQQECQPVPGPCFQFEPLPTATPGISSCADWEAAEIPEGSSDIRSEEPNWAQATKLFGLKMQQVKDVVHLAFVGDQITQQWNSGPVRSVFQDYFAYKLNAIAFGIPGDTTLNLLWRLQNGEMVEQPNLKATVVQIGMQDILRYYPAEVVLGARGLWNLEEAAARVANGIAQVATQARANNCRGSEVLVMALLPYSSSACPTPLCTSVYGPIINAVNTRVEEWASSAEGARFVDCSSMMVQDGGSSISASLMPDGRIPNAKGMQALAECLTQPLEAAGLSGASPGALGVNLFFSSSVPDAPVKPTTAAPANDNPPPSLWDYATPGAAELSSGSMGILTEAQLLLSCEPARCYKDTLVQGVSAGLDSCKEWEAAVMEGADDDGKASVPAYAEMHAGYAMLMGGNFGSWTWVVYSDGSLTSLQASDYAEVFGPDAPLVLSAPGDTSQNVLWRVQNGEGLESRGQDIHSAVVVAGNSDLLTYFPGWVLSALDLDPSMLMAAARVANVTINTAAALRGQSCTTEVTVLGLLPSALSVREPTVLPIIEAVNSRLRAWAQETPGVTFLDCNSDLLSADGATLNLDFFSNTLLLTKSGSKRLVECMAQGLDLPSGPKDEPVAPSTPASPPDAISAPASGGSGPGLPQLTGSTELSELFTNEDLTSGCSTPGTCYPNGVLPVELPQLPLDDQCSAWQVAGALTPLSRPEAFSSDPGWLATHSKFIENVQTLGASAHVAMYGGLEVELMGLWQPLGTVAVLQQDFGAIGMGINRDTSNNLLWRVQNGEADGLLSEVAIVWVGEEDITRYFPPHIVFSGDDQAVQLVARKIVNTTAAAATEIKWRSCEARGGVAPAHVVLAGVLPRGNSLGANRYLYEDYRPVISAINAQLAGLAAAHDGFGFMDCAEAVMFNSKYMDSKVVPTGELSPGDSAASKQLAVCVRSYLEGLLDAGVVTKVSQQDILLTQKYYEDSAASGPSAWAMAEWGPCSSGCGGLQTRAAICQSSEVTGIVIDVDPAKCDAALMPASETQECNTDGACMPAGWVAGPWGQCSASCGEGTMQRSVWCLNGQGEAPDVDCLSDMPPTTQPCEIAPCDFCEDNPCSGNGACSAGACGCTGDFTGLFCQVPEWCPTEVASPDGECCLSGQMSADGVCCPVGQLVDAMGGCCPPTDVDSCGVCGGSGGAVDILGICCEGTLDASGVCCQNGAVDECGVCGGSGSTCAVTGTARISLELSEVDASTPTLDCTELSESFVSQVALSLKEWGLQPQDITVAMLSTVGADATEGCGSASTAAPPALSAGGPRRLLQSPAQVVVVMEYTITPPSAYGAQEFQPLLESDVRSILSYGQMAVSAGPAFVPSLVEVRTLERRGVCGNGWCEVGESAAQLSGPDQWTVSLGPGGAYCLDDCPRQPLGCAAVSDGGLAGAACGGRGLCVAALGACDCFVGFGGPGCAACAAGFFGSGTACVPLASFATTAVGIVAGPAPLLPAWAVAVVAVLAAVVVVSVTAAAAWWAAASRSTDRAQQPPSSTRSAAGNGACGGAEARARLPRGLGSNAMHCDAVRRDLSVGPVAPPPPPTTTTTTTTATGHRSDDGLDDGKGSPDGGIGGESKTVHVYAGDGGATTTAAVCSVPDSISPSARRSFLAITAAMQLAADAEADWTTTTASSLSNSRPAADEEEAGGGEDAVVRRDDDTAAVPRDEAETPSPRDAAAVDGESADERSSAGHHSPQAGTGEDESSVDVELPVPPTCVDAVDVVAACVDTPDVPPPHHEEEETACPPASLPMSDDDEAADDEEADGGAEDNHRRSRAADCADVAAAPSSVVSRVADFVARFDSHASRISHDLMADVPSARGDVPASPMRRSPCASRIEATDSEGAPVSPVEPVSPRRPPPPVPAAGPSRGIHQDAQAQLAELLEGSSYS